MPLYEYECAKHGRFERIQKFSDKRLSKCPTCGGPVEKLMSSPAIQFKGTGWYVTDYARKDKDSSSKDSKDKGSKGAKDTKDSKDSKDSGTKSSDTKSSDTKSESSPSSTTSPKGSASSSSSSK